MRTMWSIWRFFSACPAPTHGPLSSRRWARYSATDKAGGGRVQHCGRRAPAPASGVPSRTRPGSRGHFFEWPAAIGRMASKQPRSSWDLQATGAAPLARSAPFSRSWHSPFRLTWVAGGCHRPTTMPQAEPSNPWIDSDDCACSAPALPPSFVGPTWPCSRAAFKAPLRDLARPERRLTEAFGHH